MITDPEELLSKMFRAVREIGYKSYPLRLTEESHDACIDLIKQYEIRIRDESAEQARKEAADRFCASCPGKQDGMCVQCSDRDAILSQSVNEGKTDAEKLAIAVKALESASISLALYDGDYGTLSLVRQALKEIQ